MNRNLLITAFLICICALSTFSQATRPNAAVPRTGETKSGPQWEYLVVSFGKVYFSDPITDTDVKTSGLSKLVSFSKAGIVIASEGVSTQSKMDTLGKFGWELVGAVGAIGGDQEMLFKRPFIPERSKQEEELIKAEGERAKLIIEEDRKRTASLQSSPANILVDLDEFERVAARNANRKKEEDRLRAILDAIKSYSLKVDSLYSNASTDKDSELFVNVQFNGTQKLVSDTNKYRASDAAKLADDIAKEIYQAAGLKSKYSSPGLTFLGGDVHISVSVIISFAGQEKTVATKAISGTWPEQVSR